MKNILLTADAGTTSCKVSAFDENGIQLAAARVEYATKYPRSGYAQQAMPDIYKGVVEGFKRVCEQIDVRRVAAIGLSGTMNGCIAVDETGEALYDNIIHSDARSEGIVEEMKRIISPEEYYRLTGNRADAHATLPKILWLKKYEPDVHKRTRWWLNTKDYLYSKLTEKTGYTDYSDAALASAMDMEKKCWSENLLRSFDLNPALFPQILRGDDVSGKISAQAARETGLPEGTPVAMGGGDGACAALGAGVFRPGDAYTCIGSSAWVSMGTKMPPKDDKMRLLNYYSMDGSMNLTCGTVQCGSAAFDWAKNNLLSGESIGDIEKMAREIPAGAEGVYFLPTLMGSRTPYWDANTRGCLMGFTLYHDRRHVARAVYEGIAYALKDCYEIIRTLDDGASRMTLTGGGANSTLWAQMLSDMYGMDVQVHSTPGEAGSLGAAIAAGVGVGLYKSYEEGVNKIGMLKTYRPDEADARAYAGNYEIFRDIYAMVRPMMMRIAGEGRE